jgi:hypothetical protein
MALSRKQHVLLALACKNFPVAAACVICNKAALKALAMTR